MYYRQNPLQSTRNILNRHWFLIIFLRPWNLYGNKIIIKIKADKYARRNFCNQSQLETETGTHLTNNEIYRHQNMGSGRGEHSFTISFTV
jgi:hypothetical protein